MRYLLSKISSNFFLLEKESGDVTLSSIRSDKTSE